MVWGYRLSPCETGPCIMSYCICTVLEAQIVKQLKSCLYWTYVHSSLAVRSGPPPFIATIDAPRTSSYVSDAVYFYLLIPTII